MGIDQTGRQRLPGNKVVRRRLAATQIIEVPDAPQSIGSPNVQTHAKRFVVALLGLIAVSTLLLTLPWATESGKATPLVDSLFTAMSATSVTGLSVVDTQQHWNFFGELLILIQIQVGGLGFMVGASVVLASLGRTLTLRDSLLLQDGSPTLSLHEATQLSKRILRFIFIAEGIGFILFSIHFLRIDPVHIALWRALFTSVSAFCNAGFDIQGDFTSLSLFADSILVNGAAFLLIQAGALSFITFSDVWTRKRWRRFALDTKLVLLTNVILLVGGTVMFLLLEWNHAMGGLQAWARPMAAFFQSASVRTCGFSTIDFSSVHPATAFLTLAIMLVGGAAGSTTGGIKLATIAVLAIAVLSTVRGQSDAQAYGRRISNLVVFRALSVTALFMFLHFVLTLALAVTEDVIAGHTFGFLPLMLESMSAIATVGLSTGITPEVSDPGKILLCIGMFVGRLGPLTAVYALQRRQQPTLYRFPEAAIRIG